MYESLICQRQFSEVLTRRELLVSLTTNMAAVTSPVHQQISLRLTEIVYFVYAQRFLKPSEKDQRKSLMLSWIQTRTNQKVKSDILRTCKQNNFSTVFCWLLRWAFTVNHWYFDIFSTTLHLLSIYRRRKQSPQVSIWSVSWAAWLQTPTAKLPSQECSHY